MSEGEHAAALEQASRSLKDLLDQPRIPAEVRAELAAEFEQVQAMLRKLARGELHVGILGRVSVGKSSLANALTGREDFVVSALHGETQTPQVAKWDNLGIGGVFLIDTPGIDEIDGDEREQMAMDVSCRVDLVLFVVDSDLHESEQHVLKVLREQGTPLLVVLNKQDQYTTDERNALSRRLTERLAGLVRPDNIVSVAADPRAIRVVERDADGRETTVERPQPRQLQTLVERVHAILKAEGQRLAALNASLFADRMSEEVIQRVVRVRRNVAEKLVRTYSLAKGVAVAANPVPVADLLAAATIDVVMVRQLSVLYGLPMTRKESGRLLTTIIAQLAALMGAVWGVHLLSSALKGLSAGLSTALTAGAQGGLAYYATYVVGRVAEDYLIRGKSWGPDGAKTAISDILEGIDRRSILADAKEEIRSRLKSPRKT